MHSLICSLSSLGTSGCRGMRWWLLGFITGEGRVITQRISGKCILRKLLDWNPHLTEEALRFFSVWD